MTSVYCNTVSVSCSLHVSLPPYFRLRISLLPCLTIQVSRCPCVSLSPNLVSVFSVSVSRCLPVSLCPYLAVSVSRYPGCPSPCGTADGRRSEGAPHPAGDHRRRARRRAPPEGRRRRTPGRKTAGAPEGPGTNDGATLSRRRGMPPDLTKCFYLRITRSLDFGVAGPDLTYDGFQIVCKCPFRALLVTLATDSKQTWAN